MVSVLAVFEYALADCGATATVADYGFAATRRAVRADGSRDRFAVTKTQGVGFSVPPFASSTRWPRRRLPTGLRALFRFEPACDRAPVDRRYPTSSGPRMAQIRQTAA